VLAALPASVLIVDVLNKIDLTGVPAVEHTAGGLWQLSLSARTGEGMDLLRRALLKVGRQADAGESVYLARARHLEALALASGHLQSAADGRLPADLLAEELRLAHDALGTIVGRIGSDALLGEIFGRFCIGK